MPREEVTLARPAQAGRGHDPGDDVTHVDEVEAPGHDGGNVTEGGVAQDAVDPRRSHVDRTE